MIDYTIADASGEASGYSYLTLTEIKNYLKVDASTDDSLLTDMFYAAASYIERQFKQTLKKRDIVTIDGLVEFIQEARSSRFALINASANVQIVCVESSPVKHCCSLGPDYNIPYCLI